MKIFEGNLPLTKKRPLTRESSVALLSVIFYLYIWALPSSFVIVDDGIHEVHHGLGDTKNLYGFRHPTVALEKGVGDMVPAAIVFHAEILDVLVIAREAHGTRLEHGEAEAVFRGFLGSALPYFVCRILGPLSFAWLAEGLDKGGILHGCEPLGGVGHDFVAAGGEDVGGEPIAAGGQHAVAGLEMDVEAAAQGLLALHADVGAQMAFVGRLVGREAGVAVEAVDTVFHLHMGYLVIELGDGGDGLGNAVVKVFAHGFVFGTMRLEPLAVVVGGYLAQEIEDSGGMHWGN